MHKTTPKEEHLLSKNYLDETYWDEALAEETHKRWVTSQYDKHVKPQYYQEVDLVLLYDQRHDLLGVGTLQPLWVSLYVLTKVFSKGAYELQDCDGALLTELYKGIYLKKHFT